MQPTAKAVNDTLKQIESAERDPNHPRSLAREAVARRRANSTIDPRYDFSAAPAELRQVVYDGTVRFSRRRLWSRLLR